MKPLPKDASTRVMIEALRVTKTRERVELAEIASLAKVSLSIAKDVLYHAGGLPLEEWLSVGPKLRLSFAMEIARAGRLKDAAHALSWQEFERFAEECLEEAGFRTERNVRTKGDGRAWQIDVIGVRGGLILSIDCKHWNTPSYLSKFKLAAEHQRTATLHLLARPVEKTIQGDRERQALPVILTLSEPPAQLSEGVVLVSVERLPSFLNGVTPYDENLPFVTSASSIVENPMSQSN